MAILTMALLTMAILTMALLTMAIPTMALLTMAIPTLVPAVGYEGRGALVAIAKP